MERGVRGEYQHLPSSSLFFFCRSSPFFIKPQNEEQAHPYPGGRPSQHDSDRSDWINSPKYSHNAIPLRTAMPFPVTSKTRNGRSALSGNLCPHRRIVRTPPPQKELSDGVTIH